MSAGVGYRIQSTVLVNEPRSIRAGGDVGYRITGRLNVGAIWDGGNGDKMLRFELLYPKLHVKSRKAPAPEGFVEHSSRIESAKNKVFYVTWSNGKIEHMYVDPDEPLSMINFKRGLVSLFQFQLLDGDHMESDVSGDCLASYTTSGPHSGVKKSKKRCLISHQNKRERPDEALSVHTHSQRGVEYKTNQEGLLESIIADEVHELELVLKRDAGANVRTKIELVLEDKKVKMSPIKSINLQDAVNQLKNVASRTLRAEKEPALCQDEQCPTMERLVSEHRNSLKQESIGGARAATAFVKIIPAVRAATTDQILSVLDSLKNAEIITQLCDLCGFAQTSSSHEAIKRFLDLDNDHDLDNWERYLWALSMGAHPSPEVLADILRMVQKKANKTRDHKLTDTLLQTMAAMAKNLAKLPGRSYEDKLVQQVSTHISQNLKACQNDECRLVYIRAMRNLQDPATVKSLLQHATKGSKPVSVTAMKALKNFPQRVLQYDTVQKACIQIFFQITKKFDSSARTLALDILLDAGIKDELLKDVLDYLRSPDKAFEVKQYVLQRLRHESDKSEIFENRVNKLLRQSRRVNNYNVLGQKGLSTAFSRVYASSNTSSTQLATVQEMNGGMLKRGVVDFNVQYGEDNKLHNIMSIMIGKFCNMLLCLVRLVTLLGISLKWIGSFVSDTTASGEDKEEEQEDATAGMEITVHGVTIRPFAFFTGQGELMGHVWSGTGSDKTPAYQAASLLYDHQETLPLQTGVIAELSLVGGTSVDLSGQVQISLWNRNAHSLIETNTQLATVQEMNGGMLKRGVLGMFAGGLGSFVSDTTASGEDKEEEQEDATAGMEITVHGVTIRPFVFFTGQGELMGHVWSGNWLGQDTSLSGCQFVNDHQETLPLQTGVIAELSLVGGTSVDLSGQVQISLWNRNAHSLIETNAGATILGHLRVDNSFVRSVCEFSLTAEPKFHISSNIDFYDKMALCMQPQQPEFIIKHNTFKIERIPGSKHRLRKATYRINKLPGKTHALNRKNSEMCNAIFR
ncbi:microsomal triglyceride transfer protein large subunit-like [Ctenocephalides felis]|uniref:microsomal triglyceride transfer protein large subunit-like n=1 Tax=Ctenocephalides felis TaxID=7515 RepID=UPI000E6E1B83|nr:microsomal triglyceride transfer protein large subunit-like [Ctenocephalides felis]